MYIPIGTVMCMHIENVQVTVHVIVACLNTELCCFALLWMWYPRFAYWAIVLITELIQVYTLISTMGNFLEFGKLRHGFLHQKKIIF